jgi:cell division protein FtsL
MPAADENAAAKPGAVSTAPAGAPANSVRATEKQYEFKPGENKIIGELASRMNFVGLFLLAVGILVIAHGVVVAVHWGPIISGTLTCVVGIWTQRASVSFRSVVQTQGCDISHLMRALEDLRKLYSLQFWLLILCILVALAGLWTLYLYPSLIAYE